MLVQRCKLCGTRSDAFGCYETCNASEGTFHEWGDFLVESEIVGTVSDIFSAQDRIRGMTKDLVFFDDYQDSWLEQYWGSLDDNTNKV